MLKRNDLQMIAQIIEPHTKVLDLGCGDGELLSELFRDKNISGFGIEISLDRIKNCLEQGLSVVQEDLNEGLKGYQDKSFDYIVLSRTLEYISKPTYLIQEMLRVGEKCIISFENLGYWKNRLSFFFRGTIEKASSHKTFVDNNQKQQLLTTKKFFSICFQYNFKICSFITCPNKKLSLARLFPNLLNKISIFVLKGS